MKKMISALLVLTSVGASAKELKFGDLNYKVDQGEQNLNLNFSTFDNRYNIDNDRITERSYLIEAQYKYGFTKKLDAFVKLNYFLEDQLKGGTDSYTINSFANPAVGAVYRILEQDLVDYNLDVEIQTKQRIGTAKEGSSTANRFDGRSTYEAYGHFGRKWNEANEWKATLGMIYHASGEAEEASFGKYDQESSTDLLLKVAYQYRPVNEFMMVVSAEALQVGEYEYGSDVKEDAHTDFTFGFMAKYLLQENMTLNLTVKQSRLNDYDRDSGGFGFEVNKRRFMTFGLGADFLF